MVTFLPEPLVQGYLDATFGAVIPCAFRYSGELLGVTDAYQVLTLFDFNSGAPLSTADVFHSLGVNLLEQTAIIADPHDATVWCRSDSNPPDTACQLATGPFSIENQWGTGGNIPGGFPLAYGAAWLQMGSTNWVVLGAQAGGAVDVLRWDPPSHLGFWGHDFAASATNDVGVCSGPQSSGGATAYWCGREGVLGKTVISPGADSYNPATWPTTNPDIVSTKIKTYVPHDFDAAWGAITGLFGPAYDKTDGNVLAQVQGTGGGNPSYIVKLRVSDGTVLWKVAVGNTGFADGMMSSNISAGYFLYYEQDTTWGGTVYAIKTSDGSTQTEAVTGMSDFGFQASDDALGCIIGQPAWNTGQGSIGLLHSTPSSGHTMGAVYFTTSSSSSSSSSFDSQFFGDGP